MINIDKLLTLKEFPLFLKYLRISFIDNLSLLIPFAVLMYLFFDKFYLFLIYILIYILIVGFVQYRLDKRIWLVLKENKKS